VRIDFDLTTKMKEMEDDCYLKYLIFCARTFKRKKLWVW